jgi:hypothetical protein
VWCAGHRATLYLVSQGTDVVNHGKRHRVDAHWFRGSTLPENRLELVKLALSRGYELMTNLHLSGEADPAPAIASKIQQQKQRQLFFAMEAQDATA